MDYTIARSALAVPSRAYAAVRVGGELPSIGLFTGVRGREILRTSPLRSFEEFAYPAFFSKVPHSLGHGIVGCSVANKMGGDHGLLERRTTAPAC